MGWDLLGRVLPELVLWLAMFYACGVAVAWRQACTRSKVTVHGS
jgi:hypothetical protein